MTDAPAPETRVDAFLGGRLQVEQPARGYRSGADAVMLAAACPARPGQHVLELGCGAGVASLCLAARVPGLHLTGVERDAGFAALARRNAALNGIGMTVIEGDLAAPPPALRAVSFDHVILNPPYFPAGTLAPQPARAGARHEETPLAQWLDVALRRLHPGGRLTAIHLAARLGDLLGGLTGRAGDIAILPIAARVGQDAGRVILSARKGARAPLRLLPPFIMHAAARHEADREDLTPQAQLVLRHAGAIPLSPGDSW